MNLAHLTISETPIFSGAMGLAFVVGMAIGGVVVFSIMRKLKEAKK